MLAAEAAGRGLDDLLGLVRYVPHSPGGLVTHAVRSAVEQAVTDVRAQVGSWNRYRFTATCRFASGWR